MTLSPEVSNSQLEANSDPSSQVYVEGGSWVRTPASLHWNPAASPWEWKAVDGNRWQWPISILWFCGPGTSPASKEDQVRVATELSGIAGPGGGEVLTRAHPVASSALE